MAITDPIEPLFLENRGTWILMQGRETFYDEDRYMREWDTKEEALEWRDKECPECKGENTVGPPAPGLGGCSTCLGDGVVPTEPEQMEMFDDHTNDS